MKSVVLKEMNNLRTYRSGGMTLVEIMVAVGITVGMLLLIGTVFKSATDASGSAMANNEMMNHMRTLTNRLEQDFSGLRTDMPIAIIFEAHQNNTNDPTFNPNDDLTWFGDLDDDYKVIRYDRISFFANGEFHPSYPVDSAGNVARIFYGQMLHSPHLNIANNVSAPRQILARRFKILTADASVPTPLDWATIAASTTGEVYDYDYFEQASVSFWKNQPPANYEGYYFDQTTIGSMVRPVDYERVRDTIDYFLDGLPIGQHPNSYVNANNNTGYGSDARQNAYGEDALQRLFFLSDVTDFKIQLYLQLKGQNRCRWFPDENDFIVIQQLVGSPNLVTSFALYWNVPDMDNTKEPTPVADPGGTAISWWSILDESVPLGQTITLTGANGIFETTWPKAIRFTFTLYDKNRQRFPDGQTFSYIVKIPPRY